MHLQRLFEIVYLLLYRKKVTAKELAERFEVSTRTIYRDIDTLSAAGIPIYTNKGKDGGIFLMEHFILNRALLSEEEQQLILSALKGVQTITDDSTDTLERMRTLFHQQETDWIAMDLSDWSNRSRKDFETIRDAIQIRHTISFSYCGSNGSQSKRQAYPLQLWFKEHTWYLKAYCTARADYRLFKLSRMQEVHMEKETFLPMQYPDEEDMTLPIATTDITLWVDSCMAYRLYDEYTFEQIEKLEDGNFLVHINYPEDEWVYGMLLSYGPYAKVLSPSTVKEKVKQRLQAMQKRYEEDVETIALHTQETKEKSSVDADGIAFKKGKER